MSDIITIDDFIKLDIRIGKITYAEKVEGADKLLKLTVDFGEFERTIVSGISQFYAPEQLIGKEFPFIINLEPRKLRGIESQGMILAADAEGEAVLINPDKEVPPGSKVR